MTQVRGLQWGGGGLEADFVRSVQSAGSFVVKHPTGESTSSCAPLRGAWL
eukprot:CAMPEP_0174295884 /NCGR_PEP_ID=MMETSP0809-20121228/46155_1 /TAXON_ID=73025 ORGANISM="Eutreptiella gymnastica-like, Strain CCMP1594" /NCGR_SAMPLE_ID=MMETSP0809 /ASSEMBLY_ACC=CAM_ASM_000658 /LENGTH=49 /DNA_ID=CAMNT_0015398501 /DNA_START=59 /DNA_END=208 /DNA_ORIENTATION=+